jgi:hypothetical protein
MQRFVTGAVLAVGLVLASPAGASAPPVGKLPPGPVQTITATRGALVAVALPHRAGGLVWRQASGFGVNVLKEVSEADVGSNVVVVFRAVGRGGVTVGYGLTKGETTGARASLRFRVTVR